MREIKFRIWCKDNNEWEKDECTISRFGEVIHPKIGFLRRDNHLLQQFTGLKDKNRKEIYEGDIIEGTMFYKGSTLPTMGVIKFNNCYAAFCVENEGGETLLHNHDLCSFDVVGNVYENPELIKSAAL